MPTTAPTSDADRRPSRRPSRRARRRRCPRRSRPEQSAPAPAGWNDDGAQGSIRREHNKPCDSRKPARPPGGFCRTLFTVAIVRLRVVLDPRQRRQRGVDLERGSGRSPTDSSSSSPTARGYPPNPPLERIDFEEQADELAELLGRATTWSATRTAASSRSSRRPVGPRLGSLTVSEPPAFGVARGDPAVDRLVEPSSPSALATGPREPRAFRGRLRCARRHRATLPEPLPPEVERRRSRRAGASGRPTRPRSRSTRSRQRRSPSSSSPAATRGVRRGLRRARGALRRRAGRAPRRGPLAAARAGLSERLEAFWSA